MRLRSRRLAAFPVLLCVSAALVAGCGSSSSSSSSSSSVASTSAAPAATASVAALVPAAIKSKGTLTVASDATYAPNEYIAADGHTVIGMDVDLTNALAGEMGLKADVKNVTFDSIIPGLSAGKYDIGVSSFTDTKARQKVVDFVTYFNAGTSFYTKASGGTTVNTLADLCGHTVGVEKGTTEQTDATTQSGKCTKAHKSAVTVLTFPDQNGANLSLSSGRSQIVMADSPVAAYAVKQSNGVFKLVGQTYGTAPYGIAIPRSTGLTKAFEAAMKQLIASGQYKTILTKWGQTAGAITTPKINGATS